jgi:peptidoglycan/LPS O-acetylase OafA/YrhL
LLGSKEGLNSRVMKSVFAELMHEKSSYIPGIDALRALAVLSVIFYHFNPAILPGGFCGVDVFFVISGYVVSGSLAKENKSNFFRFAFRFYARRIIRIYPALIVCLMLVGILQTLLVPSSWLSTTSNETAMYAYFGASNFALIWFNDGYFSPRAEFNAFTHTWSLAVEEQFYLLFPMIFFVWMKGRERKDTAGFIANWLLAILLTVSLFYSWFETSHSPDHAFYLLPSRFWELACGALLFQLHARNKLVAHSEINSSRCAAIGLILIGMGFVLSDAKSFPFPWAALSVGGALFVIAGAVSATTSKSLIGHVLTNRSIVYIGKMSYSLYLWHWPVFVLFRWTVGLERLLPIVAAIALTALTSFLSYQVVEKPVRRSRFVLSRPDWHVVSSGILITCLCAFFSLHAVFWKQSILSLSVTKDKRNWYPESWPSNSDKSKSVSSTLVGRKIFVLGDSHTWAYSTMLRKLSDEHGVAVQQYTKSGCTVANLLRATKPECVQFIQQTILKIKKEAAPGDIVFLAALRMNRLGDQWKTFNESDVVNEQESAESASQRSIALRETDALIASLEKASLVVVIDAPKPIFKSPPFRCSDWFNSANPVCAGGLTISRSFLLGHRALVMESLRTLKDDHPRLLVWDPFPILCPSETCSTFDEKIPLFFDGDHLSAHGNRVLYPSFFSLLMSVWQPKPFKIERNVLN